MPGSITCRTKTEGENQRVNKSRSVQRKISGGLNHLPEEMKDTERKMANRNKTADNIWYVSNTPDERNVTASPEKIPPAVSIENDLPLLRKPFAAAVSSS